MSTYDIACAQNCDTLDKYSLEQLIEALALWGYVELKFARYYDKFICEIALKNTTGSSVITLSSEKYMGPRAAVEDLVQQVVKFINDNPKAFKYLPNAQEKAA